MSTSFKTPEILYKYRDFSNSNHRRILFNYEIYLPSASMFNDPYEGSIPFEYKKEEITPDRLYLKMRELTKFQYPHWTEQQVEMHCWEAKEKDLLNDPNHIDKMREQNKELIDKTFGILSLTSNPLNYLMWSHYSNSHRGFCIGFNRIKLFDKIGIMGPVVYKKEIPKMGLFGDPLEFYINLLSTKSDVWEYEEEYRFVKSDAARSIVKYDKSLIEKIVLGCKMEHNEKLEIINFVRAEEIPCKISELKLNLETFKLDETIIYQ